MGGKTNCEVPALGAPPRPKPVPDNTTLELFFEKFASDGASV